ncbi:MAG: methyltransferase [Hyphomicrobiales bacterium]|nr:methyltransferase [Hyphomicrobiales bacterium]
MSEDRLLGERVVLYQPKTGYRAAIDPVFLAAAVDARPRDTVLDVGCGVGAAALCLAFRCADVSVTGLDVDFRLVEIAEQNGAANGMAERLRFLAEDVSRPAALLRPASFDHVMTNPPYAKSGTGRPPRHPSRHLAMVEDAAPLGVWLDYSIRMVRPRGTVTVIHRADRLEEILRLLAGRLGGVTVLPLWPGGARPKPAGRVIVRGRRGASAPFRLLPGIVLHDADGRYTASAERILRHGAPVEMEH